MSTTETLNKSGLSGKPWQNKSIAYETGRGLLSAGIHNPGPIAMIDMGQVQNQPQAEYRFKHRDFDGDLVEPLQTPGTPSKSGHAMEVAGILEKWCDAPIRHYNVWTEQRLDLVALKAALEDVKTAAASVDDQQRVKVLNLSIGIDDRQLDPADKTELTNLINDCVAAGVFVVAAVGESDDGRCAFPANLPSVIAVSAANSHDRPLKGTSSGAFIAAPGESIDVMIDDDSYRKQDGSSYAAPVVSAAIWLVLRKAPNLTQTEMCEKLCTTASKPNVPLGAQVQNALLGCGVIDLEALAR